MKHVNLVVADGDRNTLGKYVSELRRMDGINVVGSTADGAELLALLSHVRADVVMTGLALKNVDGLGVLEAVELLPGFAGGTDDGARSELLHAEACGQPSAV